MTESSGIDVTDGLGGPAGDEQQSKVAGARSSGSAAVLSFDGATKVYPGRRTPAISKLSLEIPAGEICVLIGPSGSGKTTAMKLVNRLIPLTEGDVTIDGRSIGSLDETELRRGIGYVFQQIGLFPHMTVEGNVGTVPRLAGWPKERIRARAQELLELVGLDPGEDLKRYPGEFSGGQQQRIGVARAMAADQPLMLMDEPFGALDPITRDQLQDDFLRLHAEVPKTVVFVTHDIDEAIKMGHRIAILREGELVQYDTPDHILASPINEFVADFVGADRGLKRLNVWRLGHLELDPLPPGEPSGPTAREDTLLRDVLSLLLTEGAERVTVLDGDGKPKGTVTLDKITGLIGPQEGAVRA
ncbi:MAG TPA: ATP-binding cassette domain-containing protein [Thermoleophilaceae bacterium]|nr:ATP-binding cassette domain-containing protein [Thermoleophilaceae bacterium]